MIGCFMSTMYNLLHIPLCTVMLILIFNSTAYCHAHSFTFYILFFISYFSFILSYVYFPCVVFSIFALSMERTRLSFHCWLYSLCIVVYVTNKTWNLKLENLIWKLIWKSLIHRDVGVWHLINMVAFRQEVKWERERGVTGSGKVHKPGLELRTPEAQPCYMSACCPRWTGSDIINCYCYSVYFYVFI